MDLAVSPIDFGILTAKTCVTHAKPRREKKTRGRLGNLKLIEAGILFCKSTKGNPRSCWSFFRTENSSTWWAASSNKRASYSLSSWVAFGLTKSLPFWDSLRSVRCLSKITFWSSWRVFLAFLRVFHGGQRSTTSHQPFYVDNSRKHIQSITNDNEFTDSYSKCFPNS